MLAPASGVGGKGRRSPRPKQAFAKKTTACSAQKSLPHDQVEQGMRRRVNPRFPRWAAKPLPVESRIARPWSSWKREARNDSGIRSRNGALSLTPVSRNLSLSSAWCWFTSPQIVHHVEDAPEQITGEAMTFAPQDSRPRLRILDLLEPQLRHDAHLPGLQFVNQPCLQVVKGCYPTLQGQNHEGRQCNFCNRW